MFSRFFPMPVMGTGSHGHLKRQGRLKSEYPAKGFNIPMTGLDQSQFIFIQPFYSYLFSAFLALSLLLWSTLKEEEMTVGQVANSACSSCDNGSSCDPLRSDK